MEIDDKEGGIDGAIAVRAVKAPDPGLDKTEARRKNDGNENDVEAGEAAFGPRLFAFFLQRKDR